MLQFIRTDSPFVPLSPFGPCKKRNNKPIFKINLFVLSKKKIFVNDLVKRCLFVNDMIKISMRFK